MIGGLLSLPFGRKGKSPPNLIFFVTSACACRCRFCFYLDRIRDHDPARELSVEEIETFARSYGPMRILSISGGEPFLRPDLDRILEIFAVYGRPRVIDLPTSGIQPEEMERVLGKFCRAHPGILVNLQISVDGPPAVHEEIRGVPGLYAKARESARRAERLAVALPNLKRAIVTVFSLHNRAAIGEYLERVERDYPFDRLIITPEVKETSIFPNALEKEFQAARDRAGAINRRIGREGISVLYGCFGRALAEFRSRINRRRRLGKFCGAGEKMLVLDQEGGVYPCEPLWYGLGNIRDHECRIEGVLNSARARDFRAVRSTCHCDWSCAQVNALLGNPRLWPGALPAAAGEFLRRVFSGRVGADDRETDG